LEEVEVTKPPFKEIDLFFKLDELTLLTGGLVLVLLFAH